MSARRAWTWCAIAGVLAFVASFLFGQIPGLKPCGPSGGLGAILAFEFVRSPGDVAALFGSEPCRSTLVGAQRTALWLDGLWFTPAYTAFLALAAWATGVSWRRWLIAVLIIAGVSDEVEGLLLWSILADLPGTEGLTAALWFAVHVKFALLALGTFGIGLALIRRTRDWLWAVSTGLMYGSGTALFKLASANVPGMMIGFTISWVPLLLAALIATLWPSVFANSAEPPPPLGPPATS